MKQIILFLLLSITISCSKEKEVIETPINIAQELIGNWEFTSTPETNYYGTDVKISFNKDKTGSYDLPNYKTTVYFKWRISPEDNMIVEIVDNEYELWQVYIHITAINNISMTIDYHKTLSWGLPVTFNRVK